MEERHAPTSVATGSLTTEQRAKSQHAPSMATRLVRAALWSAQHKPTVCIPRFAEELGFPSPGADDL
jgi:hypothetical protein